MDAADKDFNKVAKNGTYCCSSGFCKGMDENWNIRQKLL
jgi:hypothetical protein